MTANPICAVFSHQRIKHVPDNFHRISQMHDMPEGKKWLQERDIAFEDRHIKEQQPTLDELKQWHAQSGLPLKRFFNTSGMLYKEMKLKDRLPNMTEDEMYQLLATDGMLVKRPILITSKGITTGFKDAA